jgi:hypothetical protein
MEIRLNLITWNIKRMPFYLELGFWNVAIYLLSESALVQALVVFFARHLPDRLPAINPSKAAFYVLVGLTFGFIIGLVGSLYFPIK